MEQRGQRMWFTSGLSNTKTGDRARVEVKPRGRVNTNYIHKVHITRNAGVSLTKFHERLNLVRENNGPLNQLINPISERPQHRRARPPFIATVIAKNKEFFGTLKERLTWVESWGHCLTVTHDLIAILFVLTWSAWCQQPLRACRIRTLSPDIKPWVHCC